LYHAFAYDSLYLQKPTLNESSTQLFLVRLESIDQSQCFIIRRFIVLYFRGVHDEELLSAQWNEGKKKNELRLSFP
jgi:hypothetical protein